MNVPSSGARRRHQEKLALEALRLALALVFSALGCSFLFEPWMAEELTRSGYGSGFRILLGGSHLAGGMALLVPRLAGGAAVALGILIAGISIDLRIQGDRMMTASPMVLMLVLLLFAACLRYRRRTDLRLWVESLGRYADQEESRRTGARRVSRSGSSGQGA